MLVEEASAVLSVSHAHPFEALHYLFQGQNSVTRNSLQCRKTAFWEKGGMERKTAQKDWLLQNYKGKNKVQEYSFLFLPFFGGYSFCRGGTVLLTTPYTCNQLSQCLARLGSMPSALVCFTCFHAVAQKLALSCPCRMCLFMFHQERQQSPSLWFVQTTTEVLWQAKVALRGNDT